MKNGITGITAADKRLTFARRTPYSNLTIQSITLPRRTSPVLLGRFFLCLYEHRAYTLQGISTLFPALTRVVLDGSLKRGFFTSTPPRRPARHSVSPQPAMSSPLRGS